MADCPSTWMPIGNPSHSTDNECLVSDVLDIPNIPVATSVADSDDFLILRSSGMLSVSAEILAAYIVAENTTTKEITFADSPYSVTALDDFINVDSSGGNVVINFIALGTAPVKPIYISQTDGAPNTTTATANGSELIDDDGSTLTISSDGEADVFVPFPTSWRTF
jgi:hypothetical protein